MKPFEPLFPFWADSYLKAFILNAAIGSSGAVCALYFRDRERKENLKAIAYIRVFFITFFATFLVFLLFHVLVGYGGGQLSSVKDRDAPFV